MAKSREEKEKMLKKIKDIFDSDGTVVFVNYHGITANETNQMRGELHDNDLGYYVAKKTLTGIALEDADIDGDKPETEGELAIVFPKEGTSAVEDKTAPARGVFEFQERFEERVHIVGGVFDHSFTDKEKMTEIAQIPSRNVLYGQIASLLNSPVQKFAMALSQVAEEKA